MGQNGPKFCVLYSWKYTTASADLYELSYYVGRVEYWSTCGANKYKKTHKRLQKNERQKSEKTIAGGFHCMFGLQLYRLSPIVCRAPDWYLPPLTGNDMKSLTRWLIARTEPGWQKANVNRTPVDIWMPQCHHGFSTSYWRLQRLSKKGRVVKNGSDPPEWNFPKQDR